MVESGLVLKAMKSVILASNMAVLIMGVSVFNTSLLSFGKKNQPQKILLAQQQISMDKRHPAPFVNRVFRDNILLNLAYLAGKVDKADNIDWDVITKPFSYEFSLGQNEVFSYHEDIFDEYKGKVVKTTNAHFNAQDGFLTDGYLFGDGVCQLASLFNWVAKEAGLLVKAPTNHDFAPIPEIAKKHGVSIYYNPGSYSANAYQNLYIENPFVDKVVFQFTYEGDILKLSIYKEVSENKISLFSI